MLGDKHFFLMVFFFSKSRCSNCCSFDTKDDTDDENKQLDNKHHDNEPAKS